MNNFTKVIQELNKEHNWRKVVFDIASKHPKVVLDALSIPMSIDEEAVQVYRDTGDLIKAIKFYRNKTQLGLRESKAVIEELLKNAGLRS